MSVCCFFSPFGCFTWLCLFLSYLAELGVVCPGGGVCCVTDLALWHKSEIVFVCLLVAGCTSLLIC